MEKFRDVALPLEERIDALLSALTVDEKLGFINYRNEGVPRLGIPPYVWWNEALHGVARSGTATVFPQAIAMAATFTPELVERMGEVIAKEGRARHFESARHGDYGTYKGLTYWSPNVNIFRDPRWGRGQETYGECPWLTGEMGAAYVRGVQGDDPEHLKAAATPKHFAVHSGPEKTRLGFDSRVSEKDLRETYLPAFHQCVKAVAHLHLLPVEFTFGQVEVGIVEHGEHGMEAVRKIPRQGENFFFPFAQNVHLGFFDLFQHVIVFRKIGVGDVRL